MQHYHQQFHVVYDFRHDWFVLGWTSVAIPLAMTVLGLWFLANVWRIEGPRWRGRIFLLAWVGAVAAVDVFIVPTEVSTFVGNRRALDQQRYTLVEGVVEHFASPVPGSKGEEAFDVAGHHYSYAAGRLIAGYHRTQSEGGSVGAGTHVRIADLNGTILRLEVLQ